MLKGATSYYAASATREARVGEGNPLRGDSGRRAFSTGAESVGHPFEEGNEAELRLVGRLSHRSK